MLPTLVCINGRSSVGRALVSKTRCREFESLRPCKLKIDMEKLSNFFESVVAEFKKVSWPTQQELIDNTIIVVVFSIILSAFIFGVDQLYSTVLEAIYR